jgi:hypothetical protein
MLGLKGDHMYKYCPRRSERVKTAYSAQQVETLEDIGKSVPNIYADLDNKKDEFQSHIIEVEGKINNQPISILIDSGDSHRYLDPKMVEMFPFPRRKLGKPWMV